MTNPADLAGVIEALTGEIVADLGQNFDAVMDGAIGSIVGEAFVSTFTQGDRQAYVIDFDRNFGGVKFFAKGRGLYLLAGSKRHVHMIDITGLRSIRTESISEELPGELMALASTPEYVFCYLMEKGSRKRSIRIMVNAPYFEVLEDIELDSQEDAAWLAVREDAGVFAYPYGVGKVVLRRTEDPFSVVSALSSVMGDSLQAHWFRFVAEERREETDQIDRRWFLYVVSDRGAKAAVCQFHRYDDDVFGVNAETFSIFGKIDIQDLEVPLRLAAGPCSVVVGGAVTPRLPTVPTFDGAIPMGKNPAGGTIYLTFWGYHNQNAFMLSQPQRDSGPTFNYFVGGTASQNTALPELFLPGEQLGTVVIFTTGEPLEWRLETPAGGGTAVADYTKIPDAESVLALRAFAVRFFPAAMLQYMALDPLTPTRVSVERLVAERLNNAGVSTDSTTSVRHTDEPNQDIPVPWWWQRDLACRTNGGVVQAHAGPGALSRVLIPGLERELARGRLFDVENDYLPTKLGYYPPTGAYDVGERCKIGASGEWGISGSGGVSLFATNYGAIYSWKFAADGTPTFVGAYAPPPGVDGWPLTGARFGPCQVISHDERFVFAGGPDGTTPGIAMFSVNPTTRELTYVKTLTWPGYSALPTDTGAHYNGYRARYGDISEDGKTLCVGCFAAKYTGSKGIYLDAGHVFVLRSEDDWATFAVKQDIQPSDVELWDGFGVCRITPDGTKLCAGSRFYDNGTGIGAGRMFVFRTDDEWDTIAKEYVIPDPPNLKGRGAPPTQSYEGDRFASDIMMSYTGDTVGAGAQFHSFYAFEAGAAWIYQYDPDTDEYALNWEIIPTDNAAGSQFGTQTHMNRPGSRVAFASRKSVPGGNTGGKVYIFARYDDEWKEIGSVQPGISVSGNFGQGLYWADNVDRLMISDTLADFGGGSNGYVTVFDVAEEP